MKPILHASTIGSSLRFARIAALLLLSMLDTARASQLIQNPGFEASGDGDARVIAGWEILAGGHETILDADIKQSGKTSLKISSGDEPRGTIIQQELAASASSAHGLRLSGSIKTEDVRDTASLFAIVEGREGRIFLDDMSDRPVRGTSDWSRYEIVIPPLPDAESIKLGAAVYGPGTAWFDAFELTEIESAEEISKQARDYLNAVLNLMEQRSINRTRIDWSDFRERATFVAKGAQTPSDTYPAIKYAIGRLGDRHSSFFAGTEGARGPAGPPAPRMVDGRIINDRFGYVEVPAFHGSGDSEEATKFVESGHHVVRELDDAGACAWIVDLRQNTGGNMWPMLAAVGPILGEGNVGAHVGAEPDERASWWYRAGQAGAQSEDTEYVKTKGTIEPYALRNAAAPVAVLTSGSTASSGEALAIAFIGRENTRSFGSPTAGYTTSNAPIPLSDGATLVLAIGYTADRAGKVYSGVIEPDEAVAPGHDGSDPVIAEAERWLSTRTECAREGRAARRVAQGEGDGPRRGSARRCADAVATAWSSSHPSGRRDASSRIPGARLIPYPTGGRAWLGHDAEVREALVAFLRTSPPQATAPRTQPITWSSSHPSGRGQ